MEALRENQETRNISILFIVTYNSKDIIISDGHCKSTPINPPGIHRKDAVFLSIKAIQRKLSVHPRVHRKQELLTANEHTLLVLPICQNVNKHRDSL